MRFEVGPTASIETITPEMAQAILTQNDHNRSTSKNRVYVFAEAMSQGEWVLNGETIKLNGDGTLLDGQHRLLAVVKSGTEQRFLVVRGLPMAAQETVDTGRARKFADVLRIRGEANSATVSAAVRIVYSYERIGVPVPALVSHQPSVQQLLRTLERHPSIRQSYYAGGHQRAVLLLTRSTVAGLHYLFASAETDDADVFFTRLSDGEGLAAGDPIYTLRDRMIREMRDHKSMNPIVLTAFTVRAFNAWRAGERLTKLQWNAGGAHADRFPAIADCTVEILGEAT